MDNDLAELKDGWEQPDPPSRSAQLTARAALLREMEAVGVVPARRRWRAVRPGWLAASTVVAATTAVVVAFAITLSPAQLAQPTQSGQPTVAPPTSELAAGQQILLNVAQVAQARPAEAGTYWYVKQELQFSEPFQVQVQSEWITRDGTHYQMFDGDPGAYDAGGFNGFAAGGSVLTFEQLEQLPTDPDALTVWMTDSVLHPVRPAQRGGRPAQPDPDLPAGELQGRVAAGLSGLLWRVPTPPAVRAGALRALAAMPNVADLGPRDGGQALRISFGAPAADKYPGGKVPPGAGQITVVIDLDTSRLLSETYYEHTVKILEAAWTDELPKVIPRPNR